MQIFKWGLWKFPACTLNLACKTGPGRLVAYTTYICVQNMQCYDIKDKTWVWNKTSAAQLEDVWGDTLTPKAARSDRGYGLWIIFLANVLESHPTKAALGPVGGFFGILVFAAQFSPLIRYEMHQQWRWLLISPKRKKSGLLVLIIASVRGSRVWPLFKGRVGSWGPAQCWQSTYSDPPPPKKAN